MALTDENTVLILGAGVSAPFGLPVGSALIDDIAENLNEQLSDFNESASDGYLHAFSLKWINDYDFYKRFPYLQPLLWKNKNQIIAPQDAKEFDALWKEFRDDMEKMNELSGLLENQTSDSIDDFIIMNESYADYVKICIAAEFIKVLYPDQKLAGIAQRYLPQRDNATKPKGEDDTTEPKKERNWIHRLINLIRLGVQEGRVTRDNKVQIITFNYDTILEYVLEQQFLNTEFFEDKKGSYRDYIDIIHVHGQCGKLEERLVTPSKTCWEWAKGIHVIRETSGRLNTDVAKNQRRIPIWIKYATEIYAAGFAFAKANTDLIGLTNSERHPQDREIYYCNYTDDIGLRNAVEKLKLGETFQPKIIEEPKIGVSDWIGVGTLGELP